MRAAFEVMRRNGYSGASVQDILEEAGLSTRAFYRQFRAKDDLLLAMFRQDADSVASRLTRQTATAAGPLEALLAWLDEMLSLCFDPRRARRVVLFRTAARQAAGYEAEEAHLRAVLTAPLVDALRRGALDGSLPDADPVPDARAIFGLVWQVAGPAVGRAGAGERDQVRAQLLRFCLPALGVARAGT